MSLQNVHFEIRPSQDKWQQNIKEISRKMFPDHDYPKTSGCFLCPTTASSGKNEI